jgi:prephenate dehydratase
VDKKMEELKKRVANSDSEAWANADHYQKETHVSIPSEEAVENQLEWLETNEK